VRFSSSYIEGRATGLAAVDARRRQAARDAALRAAGASAVQRANGSGPGQAVGGGAKAAGAAVSDLQPPAAYRSLLAEGAIALAERDRHLLAKPASLLPWALRAAGEAPAEQLAAPIRHVLPAHAEVPSSGAQAASSAPWARAHEEAESHVAAPASNAGPWEGDAAVPSWAVALFSDLAPPAPPDQNGPSHAAARTPASAPAARRTLAPLRRSGEPTALRPSSADTLAAEPAGPRSVAAAGSGAWASAGGAALRDASLYRTPNGRALLAVQAAQLSRVLLAERRAHDDLRRPVFLAPEAEDEFELRLLARPTDGGAARSSADGWVGYKRGRPWAAAVSERGFFSLIWAADFSDTPRRPYSYTAGQQLTCTGCEQAPCVVHSGAHPPPRSS
jgi:collagen type I/II/III/V/XI/XXIV/XXVII alpha